MYYISDKDRDYPWSDLPSAILNYYRNVRYGSRGSESDMEYLHKIVYNKDIPCLTFLQLISWEKNMAWIACSLSIFSGDFLKYIH